MDIVTADFNWITLLVIIIVSIIGRMRSKTRKAANEPVFPPSEAYNGEEETGERRDFPRFSDRGQESLRTAADTIHGPESSTETRASAAEQRMPENTPVSYDNEENEGHSFHIDLRQAVIYSEILRRPDL